MSTPTKPISPDEAETMRLASLPAEVIEAFNACIAAQYINGRATVRQDDVIHAILARMPGATRDQVFQKHWLDVEPFYRETGWEVRYERPCGMDNESFAPFYTFSKKR